MKKIILLIQGIVLSAIGMSYGQSKITADSVRAPDAKPAPGLEWSRTTKDGKALYFMYDPITHMSYPMYTGQYANYLFLGKQEAQSLYQPLGNYQPLGSYAPSTGSSVYMPYVGASSDVNLGSHNLFSQGLIEPGSIITGGNIKSYRGVGSFAVYLYGSGGDMKLSRDSLVYGMGLGQGGLRISSLGNGEDLTLSAPNLSAHRNVIFQDKNYTGVADLTDIPSMTNLVPYSGATTNVNLGNNQISANSFIKSGGLGNQYLMADGSVKLPLSITTNNGAGPATLSNNILNIPTPTLAGLGAEPALNGTGLIRKNGSITSYDNTLYQPKLSGVGVPYVNADGSIQNLSIANGNVGYTLVTRDQNGSSAFNQLSATKFGIGTAAPATNLDVRGQIMNGGQDSNLDPAAPTGDLTFLRGTARTLMGWNRTGSQGESAFVASRLDHNKPDAGYIRGGYAFYDLDDYGGEKQLMRIEGDNGNVGIGVTNPQSKLDVAGTIHAGEVLVDQNIFPDYVFDEAYKLPDLSDVKSFIEKNHHLNGMPSAHDIVSSGLKIGEVTNILTRKVEELTLYLIQKDRELLIQQKRIDSISKRLMMHTKTKKSR